MRAQVMILEKFWDPLLHKVNLIMISGFILKENKPNQN